MALEARGRRSISPASSGRSTPVSRTSRKVEENETLKNDKTFRRYNAAIERALSSWEISPEEWADYIAFLGRLLKAIQAHDKNVAVLPHSTNVASKLAQCLNPALPPGVHQKALEVYAYIFSTFGRSFVASHLDDFAPGLFAVVSFASLSVRPRLYDIFEEHIVPLSPLDLRPVLRSLILSLLPVLEDESSEDFDRAFKTVEVLESKFFQDSDGDLSSDKSSFFWQCLFLAVIACPPRRQGALNYCLHRLPIISGSQGGTESTSASRPNGTSSHLSPAAEAVMSPEPGLLIRAFVCGLLDSQLLIQRGFLDLLVTRLPLSSPLLQHRIRQDDLDRLVTAALDVLLRKEMSLNRRLWSWFLGPEPKAEASTSQSSSPTLERGGSADAGSNAQLKYFSTYGKASLERCVLAMFQRVSSSANRARPFRICLSLMDRWEIGGSIVAKIFLPAITSVYQYSLIASGSDTADLVRSASLFFDGVEATLIWSELIELVRLAFATPLEGSARLDLLRWVAQRFNIKDEEMITVHVPHCILYMLTHMVDTGFASMPKDLRISSLDILSTLMDFVPERAFVSSKESVPSTQSHADDLSKSNITGEALYAYYHPADRTNGNGAPYSAEHTAKAIHKTLCDLALTALRKDQHHEFVSLVSLLLSLHEKILSLYLLHGLDFLRDVILFHEEKATVQERIPFPTIASTITLVIAVQAVHGAHSLLSEAEMIDFQSALMAQVWHYLSPSLTKYHVEASKAVWQIQEFVTDEGHLEASLTALIRSPEKPSSDVGQSLGESANRFAVLWGHTVSVSGPGAKQTHSSALRRTSTILNLADTQKSPGRQKVLIEPLMAVLDFLQDPQDASHNAVKTWLQDLPTLDRVFQIHFDTLRSHLETRPTDTELDELVYGRGHGSNVRELEYVLGHLLGILKHANAWTWECLSAQPSRSTTQNGKTGDIGGLEEIVELCAYFVCDDTFSSQQLGKTSMGLLAVCLSASEASSLSALGLDLRLIKRLIDLLEKPYVASQDAFLSLIATTLKLPQMHHGTDDSSETPSRRMSVSHKRPSTAGLRPSPNASRVSLAPNVTPPSQLFVLLRTGFSSKAARPHIGKWLEFLSEVLPIFSDAVFSNIIPLVECLCKQLKSAHGDLVKVSQSGSSQITESPESSIMALLEALEMVLARSHQCLNEERLPEPEVRPSASSRGLLGNAQSGAHKADGHLSKTSQSNNHLAVILIFQDTIQVTLGLWAWASENTEVDDFDKTSAATSAHNALRVRYRTRSLLEQIFSVEPLESLEVIIARWCFDNEPQLASASLKLLHVLQGTRPKNVIPAILDALCSRANPSALPQDRLSTQSTNLASLDIALFFHAYLESTEDDAMDEVWPDCMAFLRDVLGNPLPYRQILPALLSVILLLAQKVDNTNFGEQRKMRRELGDLFNRLLSAAFTTMPAGHVQDLRSSGEGYSIQSGKPNATTGRAHSGLGAVLRDVTANIEVVLETTDRATVAINSMSTNLVGPIFRAKTFPGNVTSDVLGLLLQLSKKAPLAKAWKKELQEAFNDPRLLTSAADMMEKDWFPVLYQLCLHDKERISELLGRLTPPSTAGIMFGVGANAARLEADRRTQLNLRRLSLLMLACPEDTMAEHLQVINEKLAELFDASPASSPSAAVKAELFMLCRALILSTGSIQLAPLWPIINVNLHAALCSLLPHAMNPAGFGNLSLLQGCKVLDLLITLSPDEFQLHEWLYVTNTIDAVYQPASWNPSALSDQIAEALAAEGAEDDLELVPTTTVPNTQQGRRRPLLDNAAMSNREDFKAMAREDFAHTVLRPFLTQLSIHAYETVYSMEAPDLEACRRYLLDDLLDTSTMV